MSQPPIWYIVFGASFWLSICGIFLMSIYITARILFGAFTGNLECRFIVIIYGIWLWHDWSRPFNGTTNRSPKLIRLLRPILNAGVSYFSARVVFDYECDHVLETITERPAMLCCHPHGICTFSVLANFCVSGGVTISRNPVTVLTLDINFYLPIWREFCLALGLASVSRHSIENLSRNRKDLAIVLGGARESLDAEPGKTELTIRARKGFFKLAIRHGAAIFPVLNIGENELYKQLKYPLIRRLQEIWLDWFSFAFPLFYGKFGLLPAPIPLICVVGKPLLISRIDEPSMDDICQVQEMYMEALKKLYDKHVHLFPPKNKLLIK